MSAKQTINSSQNAQHMSSDINEHEHHNGTMTNQTSNGSGWSDYITPKMDNMADLFSLGCSTALIFGGLVPYIPQYIKIKNSGSSDGFSTYVCLTLLLANILRIAFWFGHRFELPLLIQSFVMIAGMLALMEICVRVRRRGSTYVIPSVRASPQRTKRSIIVTASSSPPAHVGGESALHSLVVASSSISTSEEQQNQMTTFEHKPYHDQESRDIEGNRTASDRKILSANAPQNQLSITHTSDNSEDSNSNINSFRDNESPILNQIHIEPESPQIVSDSQMSSSTGHSYANGYLSAQRHKRSALVKWLNSHYFWDWDDLFSYVKFLTYFTVVLGIITFLLLDNHLYIESLGYVALFTEAILGMPQLTRNFQKKSTLGMSIHMVIMWLSGDLFKTLYYILKKLPVQFLVCGSIQVIVDILILTQVLWYKRPQATYRKLPKVT